VRHEQKEVDDRRLILRNCVVDEGRPLEAAFQEEVSNGLPPLRAKAVVVSREGKGPEMTGSRVSHEEERE
jgi:hypothetical protein